MPEMYNKRPESRFKTERSRRRHGFLIKILIKKIKTHKYKKHTLHPRVCFFYVFKMNTERCKKDCELKVYPLKNILHSNP